MKHCATCTCKDGLLDAEQLLNILTNGSPPRKVYRGDRTNRWFVTCGGGETAPETVQRLALAGSIRPTYSTTKDCFYVGRTIDMERSVFTKKNRQIVYLDV